ncbi:MAG: thymidine phosphorylase [Clostridiaceae bacterium]|nr:thymidine phosphorylase [Clostridiaceae bacterium]
MHPVDLIIKKRDGAALSAAEIQMFVDGVSQGSWPDYQVSAMLMALFIRGMSDEETSALTLAMAASGRPLDLTGLPGVKVDKHSTGGVGDTTTLVLAPLVAACGVQVVKMSGRGLGFTGGTIDKLESIPGFQAAIDEERALQLARANGLVIMAQTDNLTPADKKLYALRDVTGTVDSIPLIAASIMSKKIAAGADAIVLDVKCGSGAFMKDLASARQLAQTMVRIGKHTGRVVTAVISSMDQPLGCQIGNTLEVAEAIQVLKGRQGGDLLDICLILGAEMLVAGGAAADTGTARIRLGQALADGSGLDKLRALIEGQQGDSRVVDDPLRLPQPSCRRTWAAPRSGYLTAMDTAGLGHVFVALGGGRLSKSDSIDVTAGLVMQARLGQNIVAGEPLVCLQGQNQAKVDQAHDALEALFTIETEAKPVRPLILDVIR